MAPLAGKPPFATDEPDSFYESSPVSQRRVRQQPPADPNKRTSAYNMYDNYLGDDNAANRQSGVGALGMGLMNMDDSDDSDDDNDSYAHRAAQSPPTAASKHAALAAATAANPNRNNGPPVPPPQPIAAPQPGYAAPIAALNLTRPEPVAEQQGRQQAHPQALDINPPHQLQNPFDNPPASPHSTNSPYHLATSPSPSMVPAEPHPLLPPVTPITPVFARPTKNAGVKFSESAVPRNKPIMRGNSEETLLPNRGEKGDDFWRRFSMVAKEENKKPYAQKQSLWLRKTQNGTTRLSRWVWVIAVILLLCIGGAIGLGWYFSHNTPDHQQPKALGGSANESAGPLSTTKPGGASGSSTILVTPTRTVARRAIEAKVTPAAGFAAVHKRRFNSH